MLRWIGQNRGTPKFLPSKIPEFDIAPILVASRSKKQQRSANGRTCARRCCAAWGNTKITLGADVVLRGATPRSSQAQQHKVVAAGMSRQHEVLAARACAFSARKQCQEVACSCDYAAAAAAAAVAAAGALHEPFCMSMVLTVLSVPAQSQYTTQLLRTLQWNTKGASTGLKPRPFFIHSFFCIPTPSTDAGLAFSITQSTC
eukprot:18995-Pelagomonas_calceolata.AAC.1